MASAPHSRGRLRHEDTTSLSSRAARIAFRQLADELTGKFQFNCTVLKADLTDDAELRTVENIPGGLTNLQLLVNNAGFGSLGTILPKRPSKATTPCTGCMCWPRCA